MSFSFTAKGRTKILALAQVKAEMDKVVAQQNVHKQDELTVYRTADTYLEHIREANSDEQIVITASGSLSWQIPGNPPPEFTGANVSIGVYVAKLEVQHQPV